MALGTPVAAAAAYSAASGTTVAPAYPTGITAGDALVLFVGMKPGTANSGTVTTPAGWTLRDSLTAAGGYGATLGADTGNTNLYVYTKDTVTGAETGTLSVTLGTNNVTWAFIVRVPDSGGTLSYGSADGQRTTAPTSPMTVALTNGAAATNFEAGDIAIWAMCIPTDVTTPAQFSAHSITATGATFDAAVEINEPDSTTGNDIGGFSAYATVSSGSSTAAPSITVIIGGTLTNVRGPVVMLRVRETGGVTSHNAVGALTGPGSVVVGSASNFTAHASSGTLAGAGSSLTGASARTREHPASGSLTGAATSLAGSADRVGAAVLHATSGSLAAPGAQLAGASARTRQHPSSGALGGAASQLSGAADRTHPHPSSGALAGPGALLAGAAARAGAPVVHATSGTLTGPGASLQGAAFIGTPGGINPAGSVPRKPSKAQAFWWPSENAVDVVALQAEQARRKRRREEEALLLCEVI